MVDSSHNLAAQQAEQDRIEADQVIGLTCSYSDYIRFESISEARSDSQKMQLMFERNMHLPAERRIWLDNPQRTDFENALERVKELASNGKNTLLFFHYAGHGICNGGYVGLFGDSQFVNFTAEFSKHFELYPNIKIVMAFDACLDPLPEDLRMDFPFGKVGGQQKIFVLTGTQIGFTAYTSWKFSELLAKHVAQKLAASDGTLEIPKDLSDFSGINGMISFYSTNLLNNCATVKFNLGGLANFIKQVGQDTFYLSERVGSIQKQDRIFPELQQLNYDNPIVGFVQQYEFGLNSSNSCQFILLDQTRSNFKDSIYYLCRHQDRMIQLGQRVHKVETMYRRSDGKLLGFQFFAEDGTVLLADEEIKDYIWRLIYLKKRIYFIEE